MPICSLENLTWPEAEQHLTRNAPIVIPLGAALKEHGKHLPLNNDKIMVEHLTRKLGERLDFIVLPIMHSSYYPAFVEYPGSVSLSFQTAVAVVVETCKSLANYGCRKFYVLNTGVSTAKVLFKAKEILVAEIPDLRFSFTDFKAAIESASSGLCEQAGGGHADEVETSMMLYLIPEVVRMSRAEPDYHGDKPGPLTRDEQKSSNSDAVYSPTGAWGDPTLATAQKGEMIVNRLLDWIENDIRNL
ncbi:MAG: creatininase family protein [Candidatus Obscuribacterales bacterium]|nr:creatininase family protein [Candidatus Obscuribacterales bacterium]